MRMERNIGRKLCACTVVFSALFCAGPAQAALLSGQAIIAAPGSVVDDAPGATNFSQEAFDEAQGVILPGNLAVDGGFIAAGTIVNSHMIFLNTPVGIALTSDFGVDWSFDGQILGVMSDGNGALEAASSFLLGAAGTVYPGSFNARGMESNNGTGVGDEGYSVVGAVITVGMKVTEPGDWIRVVTRGTCELGTACYVTSVPNGQTSNICKTVTYRTADGDCLIEVGEKVRFKTTIEVVNNTDVPWDKVVVGDCFFRDLVLRDEDNNPTVHTQHGGFQVFTAGNNKTCIRWKPGDLGPGESATLVIDAETGVDRRGNQEYTRCSYHSFNNGALLRFVDPHKQSFRTGPLVVSVLTPDAAGDCDGDGFTDQEELDAGTDPHDPDDSPDKLACCDMGPAYAAGCCVFVGDCLPNNILGWCANGSLVGDACDAE